MCISKLLNKTQGEKSFSEKPRALTKLTIRLTLEREVETL